MALDKEYFMGVIQAAKQEQQSLKERFIKQEAVVAFCEVCIKKLDVSQGEKAE